MSALEPGEIGETWLLKHKDTPRESRPVFLCKALDGRQLRELIRTFNAHVGAVDEAFLNKTLDILLSVVHGWRNFKSEFSRDNIELEVTHDGQREIIAMIINGNYLSHEEKKSSES